MISKNKKQDLIQKEWRKKVLESLEEYVMYKGSLQ